MNKNELESKIEETKKWKEELKDEWKRINDNYITSQNEYDVELRDLQKQLEQVGKRYRAERDGEYWSIDNVGDVISRHERFNCFDNYRYTTGNYFATKAEAEAYKQALLKVGEYECEIDKQCHITDVHKFYAVTATYEFCTEQQAEEFADALKLILNVKGASESIVTKERFKSVEFEVDNSGN
jgi:hypothetical protein